MSSRRKKPQQKLRASRPVDPRYAPGPRPRQDNNRVALLLLASTAALALVAALIFLLVGNNSTPVAGVPGDVGSGPGAAATQTTVAFVGQTAALARISPQEAIALYNANNAKFIDVRPPEGYNSGHIKGASNIPYDNFQSRIAEVPREGNVILYCQ